MSQSGRLDLLSSHPSIRMSQYERMLPGAGQHVPVRCCGSNRCVEQRLPCLEEIPHEADEEREAQSSSQLNREPVGEVELVLAGVPRTGNVVGIRGIELYRPRHITLRIDARDVEPLFRLVTTFQVPRGGAIGVSFPDVEFRPCRQSTLVRLPPRMTGSTAPNKMVSDVAYRAYQITHSVFLEPAFDMKADMCSAANRR
jgi:hypothetical protein